jgi:C4-dicarboxylate transporter DctM subunit
MVVYRDISFRERFDAAAKSVYLTAQVFIIAAVAGVYSWLLTVTGAAQAAVDFIAGLEMSTWLVLLVINIFLLLIGAVLGTVSAILVLTPLLADIVLALGVHPVHFGMIAVLNLTIGTFTPPFGFNIFVAQAVFRVPLNQLYPGLMPFIALAIAALMVVTYVPALSLWILDYI